METFKKRAYCEKHPTHTVHPKYGKCFMCRLEDKELVLCKSCEENYHDPKFPECFKCHEKEVAHKQS